MAEGSSPESGENGEGEGAGGWAKGEGRAGLGPRLRLVWRVAARVARAREGRRGEVRARARARAAAPGWGEAGKAQGSLG